jgi:Tol biopolymer transport system component
MPRTPAPVALLVVIGVTLVSPAALAQVPGPNVNMVSGTSWPGGDPFLQRQNEPSIAVSSRNALHLMAGANDYRTVDLPGLPGYETGDAWLGIFTSLDGGQTWRSSLLTGYPQDTSPVGVKSPLKGFASAADPTMRAGADGLFFFSGIVFNRGEGGLSRVFVARFIDRNDETQVSDTNSLGPILYLGTSIVEPGTSGQFVDKPYLAVDIPRSKDKSVKIDGLSRKVGKVYVAYTIIQGTAPNEHTKVLVARSVDGGGTFQAPVKLTETLSVNQGATIAIAPVTGTVHVAWRVVRKLDAYGKVLQPDAIYAAKSTDGGVTFTNPVLVSKITPFEQGTTPVSFRTTMYPTLAVDGAGRAYLAWASFGDNGRTRIVVSTSPDGLKWSTPSYASPSEMPASSPGHQLMPALTFAGGRLMLLYYDLREDHTAGRYEPIGDTGQYAEYRDPVGDLEGDLASPKVFNRYVADASPPNYGPTVDLERRHTIDVRVARATPSAAPVFDPSVRVSQYHFGSQPGSTLIEQLYYNPPNLPMFRTGTVPFMGDFIDIAAQTIVPTGSGGWTFNTASTPPPVFHAVWTDNRHVIQPKDGDWTHYTPPRSAANTGTSRFDPSQPVPDCEEGQAGSRNQDVFSARISDGLVTGAPASAKQVGPNQRAFAVSVQNATGLQKTFRLEIAAPLPSGVQASFLQFDAGRNWVDVTIPAQSTIARTVFVIQDGAISLAKVQVNVTEFNRPGGVAVPGGLSSVIALNADPGNPVKSNGTPEIFNPQIANPQIANPQIANPQIANPQIANPQIANPQIANPQIANPQIANPQIANPQIANPQIANPQIANPQIANGSMTDATWTIQNIGNTAAAYYVKLLHTGPVPQGFEFQLVIHRLYQTPQVVGCDLGTFRHTILAANIVDPRFITSEDQSVNPSDTTDSDYRNATVLIGPGEEARVTLRAVGPSRAAVTEFLTQNVTAVVVPQPVPTFPAPPAPPYYVASLDIATSSLPVAVEGRPYSYTLLAMGGTPPYAWGHTGTLPQGLDITAAGVLTGTAPTAGIYSVAATVTDAAVTKGRTLSLQVDRYVATSTPTLAFDPGPVSPVLLGLPISPAVRVRALSSSSPVPGLSVTLSLQNNPGGATLNGIASLVTDASGYVTFSNLSLNAAGSGYSLLATASGAVSATSSAFDVANDAYPLVRLTTDPREDMDGRWSPDGQKVVFHSFRDGNQNVYVVNADGTGETRLTDSTADDGHPVWLSSSSILFASNRGGSSALYTMTATGGAQTPIPGAQGASNPSPSPDGTRIAFTRGTHIWVTNVDGSNQVELTTGASETDDTPRWSPDGTKIAFASDRDGQLEIYVMNTDGTGQTRLTHSASGESSLTPAWSPDGSRIAFWSERDCGVIAPGVLHPCEIYVMNADGSQPTNLTGSSGWKIQPDWSPDGTRMLFTFGADIYVLPLAARLTTNASGVQWSDPVWSPDGSRIAFQAGTGGGSSEVYVTTLTPGVPAKVPSTPKPAGKDDFLFYSSPWSPDGSRLALQSNRDGSHYGVYVINRDGSALSRLTDITMDDTTPAWSPAGSQIAYRCGSSGVCVMNTNGTGKSLVGPGGVSPSWSQDGMTIAFSAGAPPGGIFVVGRDGSGLTQLAWPPLPTHWETLPRWSPDGSKIAYYDTELWTYLIVMDSTGGSFTSLALVRGSSCPAAWSPDGRRIAYTSVTGDIAVIDADGAHATQLTFDRASSCPSWSPDGSQVTFGSTRDGGNGEIYVMRVVP